MRYFFSLVLFFNLSITQNKKLFNRKRGSINSFDNNYNTKRKDYHKNLNHVFVFSQGNCH